MQENFQSLILFTFIFGFNFVNKIEDEKGTNDKDIILVTKTSIVGTLKVNEIEVNNPRTKNCLNNHLIRTELA